MSPPTLRCRRLRLLKPICYLLSGPRPGRGMACKAYL
jgi:hypothetical protein